MKFHQIVAPNNSRFFVSSTNTYGHSILQAAFDIYLGYLHCLSIVRSGAGEDVVLLLVFYSRYRYVSPDGSSFQYTSVLLLIQCTINYVIAVLGKSSATMLFCRTVCYRTGTKAI